MSTRQDIKFVVFTTNRSGSTWVMSTLNNLPNVTAQGELFLPRPRKKEQRWDSDFSIPRYIETRHRGPVVRPFSVFKYLDNLYKTSGCVGFKLMYRQLGLYPEILVYMLRHQTRVVHLVRQNHLDVLVSYAVKAKLGQAHLLSGQTAPEDLQVELDTKNLLSQLERLQNKQILARKLLYWTRLPHIEACYEELVQDPQQFGKIWEFLSTRPEDHGAGSNVVKIRKGGQRDVIRNYNEVREVLTNSKFVTLLE